MVHRAGKITAVAILLLATVAGGVVIAAPTASVTASAVVLSKNQCRFLGNNFTLDFGTLDPLSAADVTATATVGFRCQGSVPVASYAIADDDGLHETGPGANRMQHSVDAARYIPYSLALTPLNGNAPKNVPQTLTVTGTISGPDYQYAVAGAYTDLVVISILP